MKKLFSILTLAFSVSVGFSQITELECNLLSLLQEKEITATTPLDDWEFGGVKVKNCTCSVQASRPSYSDVAGWTGITTDGGNTMITELRLLNTVTDWAGTTQKHGGSGVYVDLFAANPTAFQDLTVLEMGATGQTNPPIIHADAFPELTDFGWHNETNTTTGMTAVPDLSVTNLFPDLVRVSYTNFANLGTYAASNVSSVNRASLTGLTLNKLTFSSAQKFPNDLLTNCDGTLEQVKIMESFSGNYSGFWYEDVTNGLTDLVFTNLTQLTISNNNFGGGMEDPSNVLFTTTVFPSLQSLTMENGGFTGAVPVNLFNDVGDATSGTLTALDLDNNSLGGTGNPCIPGSLSTTSKLQVYSVANNDFEDLSNGDFDEVTDLTHLNISGNDYTCGLATLDIDILEDLVELNIASNNFSGVVPIYYTTDFGGTNGGLELFYCSENLLTDMPTFPRGLEVLRMSNNFFDLDDVFNAAFLSRDALDDGNDDDFVISPMYSRWGVTTMDISTFSLEPDNAGIELTAREGAEDYENTTRFAHQWIMTDGFTGTTLPGTTGTFDWAEERGDGTSGNTWYCQISLREVPRADNANVNTSDLFSELVIDAGRTKISYNTGDPCDYSGTPSSTPFVDDDENDGQKDNTARVDEFEFADSPIQNDKVSAVSVYPNPTNGIVTIKGSDDITYIELVDLSGKVMRTYPANGNQVDISTNGIEEGTYLLRVNQNGKVTTSKIVKAN